MKTKQLISLLALTLVLVFSVNNTALARQNKNNIFYNIQEFNGTTVGQILYKENNKMLSQLAKYSYTYNNQGQIIENDISVWNDTNKSWEKGYKVCYSYEGQQTTVEHYKWNRDKGVYVLDTKKQESFIDYSR